MIAAAKAEAEEAERKAKEEWDAKEKARLDALQAIKDAEEAKKQEKRDAIKKMKDEGTYMTKA